MGCGLPMAAKPRFSKADTPTPEPPPLCIHCQAGLGEGASVDAYTLMANATM
jgi:hypothetical protein